MVTRVACMGWVPKALERSIELGLDASDSSICVSGDETLLRELLNKLLDNAIR